MRRNRSYFGNRRNYIFHDFTSNVYIRTDGQNPKTCLTMQLLNSCAKTPQVHAEKNSTAVNNHKLAINSEFLLNNDIYSENVTHACRFEISHITFYYIRVWKRLFLKYETIQMHSCRLNIENSINNQYWNLANISIITISYTT